jgi:SAM-dependent methyltransferase
MHRSLLQMLVDPVDHGALTLDDQSNGATLVSDAGRRYSLTGGIPRMVATIDEAEAESEQAGTAETFGSKWSVTTDAERDELAAFQYTWFDQRFGWGDESGLASHLAGCANVLDAGSGTGYDAKRYARLCPGQVVGFDLSSSVDAAHERWGERENLHFLQADIMRPPFRPGSFDFVVSDQVIHHTPDCPRAFATLAELVAPGGQFSVYVYRRKALMRELADEHFRAVTTKLSVDECMEVSEQITELGRELSRTGARITLERGVPLLGIEPGEHDVQRLIYWCFLKCFWNEEWSHELNVLTNFDWYHPPFASRHTPEEVEGWCADAGLEVLHLDVIESGISVRAARPE